MKTSIVLALTVCLIYMTAFVESTVLIALYLFI